MPSVFSKKSARVIGVILVFLAGCVVAVVLHFAPQNKASIYSPNPFHDFGRILAKDGNCVAEHDYVIVNNTKNDAKIKKVTISCYCVKILTPIPREFKAGTSTTLRIQMKHPVGKLEPTAVDTTIELDSAETPTLTLRTVGGAQLFPVLSRNKVELGLVPVGRTRNEEITLFYPSRLYSTAGDALIRQGLNPEITVSKTPVVLSKEDIEIVKKDDSIFAKYKFSVNVKPKEAGVKNETVFIDLWDGSSLSFNIKYEVAACNAFELPRYYLTAARAEESFLFNVKFVPDINDNVATVHVNSTAFEIVKNIVSEDEHVFHVKFLKEHLDDFLKKQDVALMVTTKSGKVLKMPILFVKN